MNEVISKCSAEPGEVIKPCYLVSGWCLVLCSPVDFNTTVSFAEKLFLACSHLSLHIYLFMIFNLYVGVILFVFLEQVIADECLQTPPLSHFYINYSISILYR